MTRLAALARKIGDRVITRFGPASASGEPAAGAAGRAAPGDPKVPAETRAKRRKPAVGCDAPESRARSGGNVTATPAGKSKEHPRADGTAAPGELPGELRARSVGKVPRLPASRYFGLTATASSAYNCALHPPPPQTRSDFWFKLMMAGGASLAFLLDFLKGHVERQIDLRLAQRDAEEEAKLITEMDNELERKKRELETVTKEQRRSGWFWQ